MAANWMNTYLELAGRLLEDAIKHHQDGTVSALEKDLQKKRLMEMYELLAQPVSQAAPVFSHSSVSPEELALGTAEVTFEQEVVNGGNSAIQAELSQPEPEPQAEFTVEYEESLVEEPVTTLKAEGTPEIEPLRPELPKPEPLPQEHPEKEPEKEVPAEPVPPTIIPQPKPEEFPIPQPEPQPPVEPVPAPTPKPVAEAVPAHGSKGPRRDAREVLGIAQKFMLINQLFSGETDKYNGYFDAIMHAASPEDAISTLKNYSQAALDDKQDVVDELKELLRKLY